MNRLKITFGLTVIFHFGNVYAQNEIFKCVDENGSIIYSNDSRSGTCQKTSLANIDKGNTVNKVLSNENPVTVREQKRAQILQGELSQEKKQLQSITDMLRNASDPEQKKKLEEMESMHKRNVSALQKELGNKANVELLLPGNVGQNVGQPNTLPISLPNEDKGSEGMLSQILNVFKSSANKKPANQDVQVNSAQVNQVSQPKTIDYSDSQNKVEIVEQNNQEPQRVILETNMITNKSLKNK